MPSGVDEIASVREGVWIVWTEARFESGYVHREHRVGAVLKMRDGSEWFHDYGGGAPRRIGGQDGERRS
jgi:hypothetical protein